MSIDRFGNHSFAGENDSVIIGSKEFVAENSQRFKHLFHSSDQRMTLEGIIERSGDPT